MQNIAASFLEFARLDRRRIDKGLSITQMERWSELKELLDQRVGRGTAERALERRSSIRIPTRLRCSFDSLGMLEEQMITDMSRGGVFIRTQHPLPIGSRIHLLIELADSGKQLQVEGAVVSNNAGPRFDLAATGMGVRFTQRGAELVRQIDDLYEREIERMLDESLDGQTDPATRP